ncbi:glucose-6-phosphate dehydrogenase assembly protein OpcA [Bifidobacterium bombi]|uniref:Glucose-6-phosphate dehydrogenase subunit, OpcA n=1 Tax=Bifidobacterium bombi DSM 19703 TaxID=1341695 RepID=A0A086BP75_9BIFI|nr:glucose-6-phosphate dehydrogenase assembly protein OpcA [Bifidobacterium bombi]KFF30739.1 glucose-6-phosphate dehydrogenase subunit, OpcA [Bifidobacterium bombi DSM 19703]
MIIDMPNTKTSAIARKIAELHEERGEAGNDRVLTLIISTDVADLESSLEVANSVSREHPCRVIAVVPRRRHQAARKSDGGDAKSKATHGADGVKTDIVFSASNDRPECVSVDAPEAPITDLDAQVRFGADAGAGEVIILRPDAELMQHADTLVIPLLVPDIPIVTWWPTDPPENPSKDRLGAMSNRRLTDALRSDDPVAVIKGLQSHWQPNDIDLSWTRITVWRAMLASLLDQPPHLLVTSVKVTGTVSESNDYLPLDMLATWLRIQLKVPVSVETRTGQEEGSITGVYLTREDGVLSLERPNSSQGIICQPGQTPQPVAMPKRTLEDCLSEELRRMDPDEIYARIVRGGQFA